MKYIILLSIVMLIISLNASGLDVTWVSHVKGVRYESVTSQEKIIKCSPLVTIKRPSAVTKIAEPKGVIGLAEAIKLGDPKARAILGKAYTDPDGIWVLRQATRVNNGKDGMNGFYYRLSYSVRSGLHDELGGRGNLQVIVLLDGTVLPVNRVEKQE